MDEVEKFGKLSTLTAYPFENCLRSLKKMVKTGPNPLAQVANRTTENMYVENTYSVEQLQNFRKSTISVEKLEKSCKIIFSNYQLSTKSTDKWFLSKTFNIVSITNVVRDNEYDQWKIEGQYLLNQYEFFRKPFKSSFLHIYVAEIDSRNLSVAKTYKYNSIMCKLVAIPCAEGTVFIPLIHTLD